MCKEVKEVITSSFTFLFIIFIYFYLPITQVTANYFYLLLIDLKCFWGRAFLCTETQQTLY